MRTAAARWLTFWARPEGEGGAPGRDSGGVSTNYTGNPSATQAPSNPPVDGTAPEVTLPADGDPLIAASVAQAFKTPADFLAFLQSPYANSATQTQRIFAAQCARLLARAGFDHRGFLAGNWNSWREDWIGAPTPFTAGTGSFGRWNWAKNAISGTAGIAVQYPSGANDFCPWLALRGGSAGAGDATVEMAGGLQYTTAGGQVDMVMEFLLAFDTIAGSSSFGVGIFDGTLAALNPTAPFESVNPKGFGLYFPVGGTNLLAYSNESGTPDSPVDTGVAATTGTIYRIRLEMQSSNSSDNSASRLICKINGAVKADIAPGSLPTMALTPAMLAHDSGGSGVMKIGAPRGTYALQAGNVFDG